MTLFVPLRLPLNFGEFESAPSDVTFTKSFFFSRQMVFKEEFEDYFLYIPMCNSPYASIQVSAVLTNWFMKFF